MRTRDEQLEEIFDLCRDSGVIGSYFVAKEIMTEIEQRVRAEIGRDSERLDWLNKDFFENGSVLFTGRYENMGTLDWKAIGVAHEDYRELGYKPTIRDAIDAAMEVE